MQLWHWLLLLGLVFLITYDPRTGNVVKYFTTPLSVEVEDASRNGTSRKAQINSDTY
jgi:hypothetical protein